MLLSVDKHELEVLDYLLLLLDITLFWHCIFFLFSFLSGEEIKSYML